MLQINLLSKIMKKLFLSLLAFWPMFTFGQYAAAGFTIHGKIKALDMPAVVYLVYEINEKEVKDSVTLNNGIFTFRGKASPVPLYGYLMLNRNRGSLARNYDSKAVYIERGTILVTNTAESIATATISGTPTNDDRNTYQALQGPLTQAATHTKVIPDETHKPQDSGITTTEKFITSHPQSFYTVDLLSDLSKILDYNEAMPLYNALKMAVKQSPQGKKLKEQLDKMKAVAIGTLAPEFELPDTTGKMIKLSAMRGKYVLIDFWASWCAPCRGESPNLIKVYNKYKDKNFTIISVSLDMPAARANWIKAIKEDGLTWTQVSDLKYWKSDVVQRYGIKSIPQNFLLDPNGRVIARSLRGEEFENKVAAVMVQQAKNKSE
ncbi:MAG: hypothetical protein JWR50_710 [Mucilaginibacter sp.]|nr:hypothetical protein [Mucilaginibacter sp.]